MKTLLKFLLIAPFVLASTLTLADHRSNRGHDNGRHNGWSQQDRDYRPDFRGSRSRYRDSDDVSVNLIVGSGYYPRYNSFGSSVGFGVGFNTFGYPRPIYRDTRPIIIERNTYIERPVTRGNVITYSNRRDSGTSLLRDLNGRCFERYVDGRGNETRTELDPSECDF